MRATNLLEDNPRYWGSGYKRIELSTDGQSRMFYGIVPPTMYSEVTESMHKGSSLSRQYLTLEGIVEVLDLIRMTKLKGYKVCTSRAVILESFLLD
jgi:hypothetical protein